MLQKLGIADVISSIQAVVEKGTEFRCYDNVPENAETPFYRIELLNFQSADTKTMFRDKVSVWIHAIAEKGSSVQVYQMIDSLREALTEDADSTEALFESQTFAGVQVVKEDETGEKHAIVQYDLTYTYGFKIKDVESA